MTTTEQECRTEAAKIRAETDGYSNTAFLLERAANEIRHLHDLVEAYSKMAKSN